MLEYYENGILELLQSIKLSRFKNLRESFGLDGSNLVADFALVPEILLGALLSVKMSLGCCYQRIGLTRVIVGKNLHKNMCVCKYTCMYTFTLVCVLIHRVGHRHIFFIVNCHVARWP